MAQGFDEGLVFHGEGVRLPDVAHYERLIEQRKANRDPLVVIRVEDLALFLKCYAEFTSGKTRVRREAKGVPT